MVLAFSVIGCSRAYSDEAIQNDESETRNEITQNSETEAAKEQKNMMGVDHLILNFVQSAKRQGTLGELNTEKEIVSILGENGYVAIDQDNQVDMVNANKLIAFCKSVNQKMDDQIVVITVDCMGGYIEYYLQTHDGKVEVKMYDYVFRDQKIEVNFIASYKASSFQYADGYLMFSGVFFSKDTYVLTVSGTEKHTALRMEPLDEKLRELNREYLLPVGFAYNNLFCVDWSKDDYSKLNFYDVFDLFYETVYGIQSPYGMDDNLMVGAVYQIPKEEFEKVIMQYVDIDSETLQKYTIYHQDSQTYEYRPRGFMEAEYPKYPYSEIVNYTENEDGTMTLLANVVYPNEDIAKYYQHEVVVGKLENGGVQYLSNRIITDSSTYDPNWHTNRFTLDEWNEYYKEGTIE